MYSWNGLRWRDRLLSGQYLAIVSQLTVWNGAWCRSVDFRKFTAVLCRRRPSPQRYGA